MTTYDGPSCECKCGRRFCATNQEERKAKSDGKSLTRAKEAKKRYVDGVQNRTVATAERRFAHWSGPELQLLARHDLSNIQVAEMTGRTLYGVKTKRRKLAREPKWQNVVGMKPDGSVPN